MMMSAQTQVVNAIIIFILAFLGIAILGALPPVEGPLAEEGAQLRVDLANVIVLAATLLGGFSFYILGLLRSAR